MTFKEKRELEELPEIIENLEAERNELYRSMSDPEFYRKNGPEVASALAKLKTVELQLDTAYSRWEALDTKAREVSVAR